MAVHTLIASLMALHVPGPQHHAFDENIFPCDRIPVSADQECLDCMNKACDEYQSDLAACGGDQTCVGAATAAYRLSKLLCDTCSPAARSMGPLVLILPEPTQYWVVQELSRF